MLQRTHEMLDGDRRPACRRGSRWECLPYVPAFWRKAVECLGFTQRHSVVELLPADDADAVRLHGMGVAARR
jgi:hypothetical protein